MRMLSNLQPSDEKVRSALSLIPLDALATVAHALTGKKSTISGEKKKKGKKKLNNVKAANATAATSSVNTTLIAVGKNATTANVTSKNTTKSRSIPDTCKPLLTAYTNAELTMLDYTRQMRICKIRDKLAHMNNEEREAYIKKNYPHLNAKRFIIPTAPKEKDEQTQAKSIFDQWRKRSFGVVQKPENSTTEVPNAIKAFMQHQDILG